MSNTREICKFLIRDFKRGKYRLQCEYCREIVSSTTERFYRYCPALSDKGKLVSKEPIIESGVGTDFKELAIELGVRPNDCCDCERLRQEMNRFGIEGCEDKFDMIVAQLKQNKKAITLAEHIKAAYMSAKIGLTFQINWLDPIPGLLREAIRRAKERENVNKLR